MSGNIRSTSSNLLLTCYLLVRFTPTMNVGSFVERPARGERRKEGRGRRGKNWWGWKQRDLTHLRCCAGVTSFRVCDPVRPRSWNSPEKEIRGSFTCSRASPTFLVSLSRSRPARTRSQRERGKCWLASTHWLVWPPGIPDSRESSRHYVARWWKLVIPESRNVVVFSVEQLFFSSVCRELALSVEKSRTIVGIYRHFFTERKL